jgi:hypothetical protein
MYACAYLTGSYLFEVSDEINGLFKNLKGDGPNRARILNDLKPLVSQYKNKEKIKVCICKESMEAFMDQVAITNNDYAVFYTANMWERVTGNKINFHAILGV